MKLTQLNIKTVYRSFFQIFYQQFFITMFSNNEKKKIIILKDVIKLAFTYLKISINFVK